MENKILEEVIVEEIPKVVSKGLNKGLVGGAIGFGMAIVGEVTYKKVIKPAFVKIKDKKAAKKEQEVVDDTVEVVEE